MWKKFTYCSIFSTPLEKFEKMDEFFFQPTGKNVKIEKTRQFLNFFRYVHFFPGGGKNVRGLPLLNDRLTLYSHFLQELLCVHY